MRANALIRHIDTPSPVKAVMPTARVIAFRQRDPWNEATQRARDVALFRESIVRDIEAQQEIGRSQEKAISLLLQKAVVGMLHPFLANALRQAAKAGRSTPSRSAIAQWCKAFREGGIIALLPEHKGRVTEVAAWWGPALEYFNQGSKPDIAAVWRRLTEVDGFTITYDQVRNYLNSVPSQYGKKSPARIGPKLYRLSQKAFMRRTVQNALPGDIYAADGYRADVYLAHPVTGDIWRPELSVVIDLKSGAIVGWRADEHEGTISVQSLWAETISCWCHVPVYLYIDNGSGYKNALMSDEATGFYKRAGIVEVIHSLPGNPHGKGWIERLFRTIKDDFLKLWEPDFYCGKDRVKEELDYIVRENKAGRIRPPSLAQFTDAFNQWIVRFNNRPNPQDRHITRSETWSKLAPIPPVATLQELKRQAVTLTVRRASIRHGKREYTHEYLHAFNGKKVVLEYDVMDDKVAVIRDQAGRWICDAHLIKVMDAIAPNRLEEGRKIATRNVLKRIDKKREEMLARAGMVIDVDEIVEGVAHFLPDETPEVAPLILDFFADDRENEK